MSIEQQYEGFVLAEREQNLRDDSYFWLTVWNPDEEKPDHFQYAATAYPSAPLHHDAVRRLLSATHAGVQTAVKRYEERHERAVAFKLLAMAFERGDVFKGDRVRVARGRKVPRGIEGRVLRVEERVTHVSRYGTWKTREDFALIDTGNGFWTVNARHLDIIERGPVVQELFDLAA